MKRRLPIGIQDFATIREEGCVYIDKTARIYDVLTASARQVFLSRPRRFGKSLLCSTMAALFEGRRGLFQGADGQPPLAIDGLDWDWKPRPVIRIDLNPGDYSQEPDELFATLGRSLQNAADKYDIPNEGKTISDCFSCMIKNLTEKYNEKVVIIIDEYDKPLLATLDNKEVHRSLLNALKGFYGVLKSSGAYLRFVFLTGVTKFSHVSIFSDLNQLSDISFDPRYADLCGITQEELEAGFAPEINDIVEEREMDRADYLAKMKRFYNGYRFTEKPKTVYNPFGLLKHFDLSGKFESYWYESASPGFLIKLIQDQHIDILHLGKQTVTAADFHKFDVENMDALPVLFQAGYLTVAGYDPQWDEYTLDYPNDEVRTAFSQSLMELYAPASGIRALIRSFPRCVWAGDTDGAMRNLQEFLKGIPYDIQIAEEKYYQSMIHLIFNMFGYYCRSEIRLADGRIDTLLETSEYVYCFEFKLNGSAEAALQQIDDKGYLTPWAGSGKTLVKVGVSFDYEKRNIDTWIEGKRQ
jgi:hypothetical protein